MMYPAPSILPSLQVAALLAAYTLAMFACYSMVPFVLQWSGAAVLNLSLLSSNLWAALARSLLLGRTTPVALTGTLQAKQLARERPLLWR